MFTPMSYVGQLKLFTVIHIWNDCFALRHDIVVVNIVGQRTVV